MIISPGQKGKESLLSSPLLSRAGQKQPQGGDAQPQPGRCLGKIGLRSREELVKVSTFLLAAFLANSFFVIGRNIGTVLFLSAVGSSHLTTAIFLSGSSTVFAGQVFSSLSRGRSTTFVNGWMLSAASLTICMLYLAALYLPAQTADASGWEVLAVFLLYFSIYIAQDIFTNFVCMQCASVAQSAFSVSDAKRLFGMVQMGNSLAAMAVGLTIGSIAKFVGTQNLLLVQVLVLFLSVLLNARIGRLYVSSAGPKKKAKAQAIGQAAEQDEPWWRNLLILAMALWGFTVIFTKTMYEYEYNILVAGSLSPPEMVMLTGYLYAGAGICSSAVNLFGTSFCLNQVGMRGAILATPFALLSVSLAILVAPSVQTTFLGRLVDLSLRWSLNNTVRTVLWIAVPQQQAATAKPWVEGTIKKMGQAFNAVVISLILLFSSGSLWPLSFLSLAFSSLLFASCVRVYRLYLDSMLTRIKRRELKHSILDELPSDENISRVFQEKLQHGGTVAQLDMLLQVGEGLSAEDWSCFFSRFHELPPAVQLKVIELGRRQPFRVEDGFLLELLADGISEPAVLEAAVLAVGDRRLVGALEFLEAHLDATFPSIRAATAVSILRIGWGVGLGAVSSTALLVLEQMLDFPLAGSLGMAQGPRPTLDMSHAILSRRGKFQNGEVSLDVLQELEETLDAEWEAAISAGDLAKGAVLALQLTHVKTTVRKQQREAKMLPPTSPSLTRRRSPDSPALTRMRSPGQLEEELSVALQAVQLLPEPRTLVPFQTWLGLLRHSCGTVRTAALGFVCEEDAKHPEVLEHVVCCLESSQTYTAAEAALQRMSRPARIQEAVLQQLVRRVSQQKEGATASLLGLLQLLKFLKRQSKTAGAELPRLQQGDLCDRLLTCSADLADADTLLELYQTTIDLRDQGFAITTELAQSRIRHVATEMCKGLAVERWLKHFLSSLSSAQLAQLRGRLVLHNARGRDDEEEQDSVAALRRIALAYISEQVYLHRLQLLQLAFLAAPRTPSEYGSTRVLAAWRLLRDGSEKSEAAVLELLDSILPLGLKSIVVPLLDRSPLERKLAVGSSLLRGLLDCLLPGAPAPPWTREWFCSSGTVLGAQLAETLLPDTAGSPELRGGELLLPKMVLLSRVKLYAGLLSIHLAEVALVASLLKYEEGPCETQKDETYIVVDGKFRSRGRTASRGSTLQAYHVICKELEPIQVECISEGGGSMLCIKRRSLFDLMVRLTPKFALGLLKSTVQTLPAPSQIGGKAVAPDESKSVAVRLRFDTADDEPAVPQELPEAAEAPEALPPPSLEPEGTELFDLDKGKNVALLVQQMEQEHKQVSAINEEAEMQVSMPAHPEAAEEAENGLIVADRQPTARDHSFSLLEKVLLLQGVKMFRHVPGEFLPSLALSCTAIYQPKGSVVCRQGEPSDATFYIVADGALGLFKDEEMLGKGPADSVEGLRGRLSRHVGFLLKGEDEGPGFMVRKLLASDTMGNTALLCDTEWPYSAMALQDTWLLCLTRRDLTDALRGRRELASAVIRGLYKTFTRRIRQLESGPDIVRVDTSATLKRSGSTCFGQGGALG